MKKILTLGVLLFIGLCGWLFYDTLDHSDATGNTPCILLQQTNALPENAATAPSTEPPLTVSVEQSTTYQAKGAAIRQAAFSEHYDRDRKNPQKLVFLSPVEMGKSDLFSFANGMFVLADQKQGLDLGLLNWECQGKQTGENGEESVEYQATIIDGAGQPAIKLVKTYRVIPNSYMMDYTLSVSNLSQTEHTVYMGLNGPLGLSREAVRNDGRKTVAGFLDSKGEVVAERLDVGKLKKAETVEDRKLLSSENTLLWTGVVNKYFAALLVPSTTDGTNQQIDPGTAQFYDTDGTDIKNRGGETIGLNHTTQSCTLDAAGQAASQKTYSFEIYIGPKDKSLFDKNPRFRELGFIQTIDFMVCCCPKALINFLAFGILGLMKTLYGFMGSFGNYGIVIIVLVALVRALMHPVTKKSQISMHKMSSLAPKTEQLKKKYANNKAELNKQMMALYKEQGASPIMGFLPMMLQMPIWIALWSAVNASVDLRGAAFLPFWITDLSVPDALIPFPPVNLPFDITIDSFNLLPILMGVAFYLQQKMMPSQAAAASNPQMAQQQKMMQIMMPIMFPLMLYKSPSGVNLYIMTSTAAGVVEQHIIRKHIKEKEAADGVGMVAVTSKTGGKVKKKKPKPFFKQ